MNLREQANTLCANIFAIVPIEVLLDQRLTFWQMRVLIALLSFRAKNTDTVWPKRETLSMRCGMHVSNISKATSELCELGWLTKAGCGGKSTPTRYKITVPDIQTLAESTTVVESTTPPLQTLAESTILTLAESARGKEQTIEQTNKSNKQDVHAMLAEFGVSKTVAKDFISLRESKRAPITKTSLEGIKREAIQAGCTVEEAIRTCCERGWAGFKADWILNKAVGCQEKQSARGWFMSATGITGKGKEIGILQEKDEGFCEFKMRVYQAEGITAEMVRKATSRQEVAR